MDIKSFFSGKNEVVLIPEDFKEIIFSFYPDLKDKYDVSKIFFAECYERELHHYPLVVMKLSSKDNKQTDYACFIPKTGKVEKWFGKLSYRELNVRDIAHKMELLVGDKLLEGKIVMLDETLAFRFRAL